MPYYPGMQTGNSWMPYGMLYSAPKYYQYHPQVNQVPGNPSPWQQQVGNRPQVYGNQAPPQIIIGHPGPAIQTRSDDEVRPRQPVRSRGNYLRYISMWMKQLTI